MWQEIAAGISAYIVDIRKKWADIKRAAQRKDGRKMTASGREFNWLSKKLGNNLLLRLNKNWTDLPLKQSISRLDQDIASNLENTLCLASDSYVLGDFNLFLMKGSHYNLYNDLVLLGLEQLIVGAITMTS